MTVEDKPQLPALASESKAKIVEKNSMSPHEEDGIVYFKPRVFEQCSISRTKIKDFKHATLNQASGKNAVFINIDFRYAEINDCYFHGATFENCNFTGAKIRRSNFRTASFRSCTFDYITVEATPIDYKQITKQLPSWPNVAQELLQSLRRNAVTLGEMKDVRDLTILEVEQEREHLRRARRLQESYYNEKYGSFSAQLQVWLRSVALWLSSVIWGHGEKVSRLIISCFFCIFAISLLSAIAEVYYNPTISVISFIKFLLGSLQTNSLELLGVSKTPNPDQGLWAQTIVACLRIVFGGMFVAYIFRSISRR